MCLLKNFLVLIFLFTVLKVSAVPVNSAYNLKLSGTGAVNSDVILDLSVQSSNASKKCSRFINFNGQTIVEPYNFRMKKRTNVDNNKNYNLELNIEDLLKDLVEEKIINRELEISIGDVDSFITRCEFKVYLLSVSSNYSTLMIKKSSYVNLKNIFNINYNKLRTESYSFNGTTDLFFKVNFLSKK